jgi:putative transposase
MPYTKIIIHTVWTTYRRKPFINVTVRNEVIRHITDNAVQKGIRIIIINGWSEHMHCLLSLCPKQNIADVMQLVKGESSFWINKNKLTRDRFVWQNEYYAVSLGETQVEKVRAYISNQEICHRVRTFDEEFRKFLKEYERSENSG